MANRIKFELNREGVRELMRSAEMTAVCKEYADRSVQSLGAGYEVTTQVGKNRTNAEVAAVSFKARRENSENNTILKALRG